MRRRRRKWKWRSDRGLLPGHVIPCHWNVIGSLTWRRTVLIKHFFLHYTDKVHNVSNWIFQKLHIVFFLLGIFGKYGSGNTDFWVERTGCLRGNVIWNRRAIVCVQYWSQSQPTGHFPDFIKSRRWAESLQCEALLVNNVVMEACLYLETYIDSGLDVIHIWMHYIREQEKSSLNRNNKR